jgi:two-component system NtrC family sensor kinase
MNMPTCCAWNAGDAIAPSLIAQESAALIVLAVTLVVYRTFRERYLLVWIAGWVMHLAASWSIRAGRGLPLRSSTALAQSGFVLALALFSAAILVYTHDRVILRRLLVLSGALAGFAIVRALWWPDVLGPRVAFQILYRLIALTAAFQLIRYRWARAEIGPWLLALSMLLLHPDWSGENTHLLTGGGGMDLLLGTSMLLLVLDESKLRTRRLGVIQTLTNSMTRSLQPGPMLETALIELKALMGAHAAWFRLLEDDKMVIVQQIGLSRDFLRERASVPKDDSFERGFQDGKPVALKISSTNESARPQLHKEGFDHCIAVPVLGKKSIIGTLTLGSKRHLQYAPEEMDFLATTAHQLGLAVENLRLLEQILRSHRQWTNTFDSIQDSVLLHDSEFRIMKANMALLRRLGRAPAEVIGSLCEDSLPRDRVAWAGCPYCQGARTFDEGEDPCFGGFSMVSTSSYREQGSDLRGTIHVVRDVTDRRLAEEKYKLLFEQMQEGVFVATPDGVVQECNDAFVRMLGCASREEVIALNLDREVYASQERRAEFRREVEAHNFVRNFEVLLRRRDGTILSAMESSFATRDPQGKIERYQGFLLDVTEKKQAEDEIRRRNRELNALNAMAMIANQSFDMDEILNLTLRQMILLLEARAGSIYVVDSTTGTFRRRADWGRNGTENVRETVIELPEGFGDLVTRSRTEVLTAEYLPHLPAAAARFVSSGEPGSWIWVLLWGRECPLGMMGIRRDAGQKWSSSDENLLVATSRQLATTIEKVRLYEETSRAYEDLRHTQEQLLQSEKMSAVGQLISGVAHELNNPLTAILGYAQLLESEGLSSRAADFVAKLFRQAQRTHRVVQNLLSFARQRKPQRYRVDVRKVLEETLVLREYDLKVNGIKLEREIVSELPGVVADPHQLEQVFLNIINNALDAMLEKGKGGLLRVCVYTDGGKVHVEFQDSGPGIKEPNKVFDPFYTTKSVGKGTGLGLSICYGIIKEHGGDIAARNRQGGGACIEIRLPSAGQGAAPEHALLPARRELAIAGRVLLVEDEDAVLEFERDVLAGAGAKVVTSANAGDARSRLLGEVFDALIISGKMPGDWNAAGVHRWLGENVPDMQKRVLFTFSAVPDQEVRNFLQENHVPFLVKPFEVAELISQARNLLQRLHAAVVGSH